MLFRAKKNHIKIAQFFSTKKIYQSEKFVVFFKIDHLIDFGRYQIFFPYSVECVSFSKMTHYLKNKIKFPFNVREKNLLFMWKSYLIIININFFSPIKYNWSISFSFTGNQWKWKWKNYWFIKQTKIYSECVKMECLNIPFSHMTPSSPRKKSEIYDDKKRRI